MKHPVLIASLLVSAIWPGGANAADSANDRRQAEHHMREFAQCVVRGDSQTTRQLLATSAGSDEERRIMTRVAGARARCLGKGRLRMNPIMMRGAMAEQLYLRTYAASPAADAHPDAPIPPIIASGQPYHAYAQCIVTRNAPAADAVLRTEPGSADETLAIQRAMPTFSSCLAGGEQTRLSVDRAALRGLMAEALYDIRMGQSQG